MRKLNTTMATHAGSILRVTLFIFANFFLLTVYAQDSTQRTDAGRRISGLVTNQKGEALAGVSILVSGSRNATITDELGKYTLTSSAR